MVQSLLAGAFTVVILVVAMASSVATTVALRDWAHSSYEASLAAAADIPFMASYRSGLVPATR